MHPMCQKIINTGNQQELLIAAFDGETSADVGILPECHAVDINKAGRENVSNNYRP